MRHHLAKGSTGPDWAKKRLLALGVLVAALFVVGLLSPPAHADGETTIEVNSTADLSDVSINGTCAADSPTGNLCTLSAAIQESNATPEKEIIAFDIPGSGIKTISLGGLLPSITKPVIIDGYSQPGASPNTLAVGNNALLKVELDGSEARGGALTRGLTIRESSDSLIRGLVINRFSGEGISVFGDTSSGATIANNNRIEGNFIGTDTSGTQDLGNALDGVFIGPGAFNTVVGGTTPSARNLISGNGQRGVFVNGGSAGNQVQGNYIGTDRSGTADLGNDLSGVGTSGASNNNTIGGATGGAGNLISGNDGNGVAAEGSGNKVLGNRIGTTARGTGPLGNNRVGVALFLSSDSIVGDGTGSGSNTIAFNTKDGVEVSGTGALGNRILSNSIFSNGGLGIDLFGGFQDASGNTANDPGDVDTGANDLQNKPVLFSARKSATGKTVVKGKLGSTPNKTYTIQFFSNPKGNEGKKFIGQKTNLTTDTSGKVTFSFSTKKAIALGNTITATATDNSILDTSEFSTSKKVVAS